MSPRGRPLLRAIPIALLAAIAAAAVTVRIRTASSHRGASTGGASSTAPASSAPSLSAPLRGPSPPPQAKVPEGAPRMIHGAPSHVHRTGALGPKTAKVGFHVNVGGPVASQVSVSPDESTLYAGTLTGELVALARTDGARRWSVALGDRVYGTPLVHPDGTIYVGTDAKRFVAISPKGDTIFRLEVDGEADSGAVFAKDGTIVFAAGKQVLAVRRGGDVAWRFTAKGKIFTAPAITESGLVIVGSQDDHVYAVGPTGTLAWSVDLGDDVDGAAVVGDDGPIYVGTDRGDVVALDATGHIVWRTPVGGFVRGVPSIARNGDVLVGTYGPVPRVVRVGRDGVVKGSFVVNGTGAREFGIHGGPLEDGEGTLFFGAQDDAVYAIDVSGGLRWRYVTTGDVDGPLTMLTDGSLVVPSEDGTVTMLLP